MTDRQSRVQIDYAARPIAFTPYGYAEPGPVYLETTPLPDHDHEAVARFASVAVCRAATPTEKAVKLFCAERDGIRYDTYAPLHPHNQARGTFVQANGANILAPAPRFGRTPSQLPRPAPQAGQHSLALLAELGYDEPQAADMLASGMAWANVAPSGG